MELLGVEEKINVLHAKRRCLNMNDMKDVIIRICDSHNSRVNKMNSRKILSLLPSGKDYIVADNEVIKHIPQVQGGGSGDATIPLGSAQNTGSEGTSGQVSDIRAPCASLGGKRGRNI